MWKEVQPGVEAFDRLRFRGANASCPQPSIPPLRKNRHYVLSFPVSWATLLAAMKNLLLTLLLLLPAHSLATAEESPSEGEGASAEQAAESQKIAAAEVQRFALAFADDRDTKLTLGETPILRYTNPLRGNVH